MVRGKAVMLLALLLLPLISGCEGTQAVIQAEAPPLPLKVELAVSLRNGHVSVTVGFEPEAKLWLGPVALSAGLQQAIESTRQKQYYMYVVYRDVDGLVYIEEYRIGKEFRVTFDDSEHVREIHGDNDCIIVVVDYLQLNRSNEYSASSAECVYAASFVSDITIPDNTILEPGEEFVKVWRMRNSGECAWPEGTELRFVSGGITGEEESVPVGRVSPGEVVDIQVSMRSPSIPGSYRGNWQLTLPNGERIGPTVYVQIVVSETSCRVPIYGAFAAASGNLGCPSAYAVEGLWMAQENFEHGRMFWREDKHEIYVLYDGHEWEKFYDSWVEGQPEYSCPEIGTQSPPVPRRGFGKLWCNENRVRSRIGWATDVERGFVGTVQDFEYGIVIRTDQGTVFVLHSSGTWSIGR